MFSLYSNNPLSVRPSRISNQLFGMNLEPNDFFMPNLQNSCYCYNRNWTPVASSNEIGSIVGYDKGDFVVNVDVQQFNAKDIVVTVNENAIQIECKHEEKQDEHGTIYRHFIRKYAVPSTGYKMDSIKSTLSSDGVLTISVPKDSNKDKAHRIIPIEQTGIPSKPVMKKDEDSNEIPKEINDEDSNEISKKINDKDSAECEQKSG